MTELLTSDAWMNIVLQASLLGSLVVIIAVCIERLLQRRISNNYFYLLWCLVLVRFVLIWAPQSPASYLNLVASIDSSEISTVESEILLPSTSHLATSAAHADAVGSFESWVAQNPTTTIANSKSIPFNWLNLLTTIWLCGIAYFVVKLISSWLHLKQKLALAQGAESFDPQLLQICTDLQNRLRVSSSVRLLIVEDLGSPATTGIFKPAILIPRWCIEQLDHSELRIVLAHELIHIRRCDGLLQLLGWLVATVHWFNPFAQLAFRKIDMHRELSCDRAAIDSMNDALEPKRIYGKVILKLAERTAGESNFSNALVHGFIGSNRKLVSQRIEMIVKPNSPSSIAKFAGAFLLVALLVSGYTAAQSPTESESHATETETQAQTQTQVEEDATPQTDGTPQAKTWPRNSAWPKPFAAAKREYYAGQTPLLFDQAIYDTLPGKEKESESWAKAKAKLVGDKALKHTPFRMTAGSTRTFRFDQPVSQTNVDNNKAFDLNINAPPYTFDFVAIKPGVCEAKITYADDTEELISVSVDRDISPIQKVMRIKFPDTDAFITSRLDEVILLGREYDDEKAEQMVSFLERRVGSEINTSGFGKLLCFNISVYEIPIGKFAEAKIPKPEDSAAQCKKPSDLFLGANAIRSSNESIGLGIGTVDALRTLGALQRKKIAPKVEHLMLLSDGEGLTEFFKGIKHRQHAGANNGKLTSVGTTLKLEGYKIENRSLGLGVIFEHSASSDAMANAAGVPGFRANRIQTGFEISFGDCLVAVAEPSLEPDAKATVVLIRTGPAEITDGNGK